MKRAVIVGIDRYAAAPLYGCANDAKDIADCLSLEQYDFDCKILLDSQATRAGILEALSTFAYAEEGDTLLFYFAGHGQVLGQAGHLVTFDAQLFDPGISLAHLAQIMESASASYKHVISILDCCHSGSAFTWTNSRPLQADDIEREVSTVNESRCILGACRPEEVALERSGHGAFTAVLTDALLGDAVNWDGDVTLLGIFEYAAAKLSPDVQTPVFKGDVAGTVILGQGFPPRRGRQIDRTELAQTIAKAHQLVDQYHNVQLREMSERGIRLRQGAKNCSVELEAVNKWFNETQQALPDIGRDSDWLTLEVRLREYRKNLSDITIGEETRHGRVLRHLGHGGYGHVWEVETEDGSVLAMKIFHGNELDDEVKVKRFTNGYYNMRKLEHPRIVRVHSMSTAPFGFAMDAIPGENLRHAIDYSDREDTAKLLGLLIDICETVQYAHSQKVKHRDIKPENIIVVRDDSGQLTPYLTDFDLAYHETNRTVTTNIGVGGVINYAAPEQLYQPNAKDARAETVDVFALAQLMFFLVTQRDPSGENFSANMRVLTLSLKYWIDDRAATELIQLYEKSTEKSPADRTQTVADFLLSLRRARLVVEVASGTGDITDEDFCRRVGQNLAPLGQYDATDRECRLTSRSGHVSIVVRLKDVLTPDSIAVDIEFNVDRMMVPEFKSGKAARDAVNVRLDKTFSKDHNVRRQAGNRGAYQVFIRVAKVSLNTEGLTYVTEVISRTVAGIEQW